MARTKPPPWIGCYWGLSLCGVSCGLPGSLTLLLGQERLSPARKLLSLECIALYAYKKLNIFHTSLQDETCRKIKQLWLWPPLNIRNKTFLCLTRLVSHIMILLWVRRWSLFFPIYWVKLNVTMVKSFSTLQTITMMARFQRVLWAFCVL